MKSGRKRLFIAAAVPPELFRAVRDAARQQDRTISSFLRRAVRGLLKVLDARDTPGARARGDRDP